jgi:hypothetical protein
LENREKCGPSKNDGFRGAGVSPAIFLIGTRRKTAGETPAQPCDICLAPCLDIA